MRDQIVFVRTPFNRCRFFELYTNVLIHAAHGEQLPRSTFTTNRRQEAARAVILMKPLSRRACHD
jgi:hypothetical protein